MKIYNCYTKEIIFENEKESFKETVVDAIKSKADGVVEWMSTHQ